MNAYQILRARMVPRERMSPDIQEFAKHWQEFKERNGLVDFTDLIETALQDIEAAPGYPNTMLVDEAQDLDLLEMSLIRKWGAACDNLYIVGDPDQCQPAGTMVETSDGPVPIEELDPGQHRILTWDRHSQAILGRRKRYGFEKTARKYCGRILTITTQEKKSRCTPDHRWLIKWNNKDTRNCCTYLMRKGDRWRTGWCQVFNSEGTLHLGTRATMEGADEAWILSINHDRKEASVDESILAAKYGFATATLRSTHLSEDQSSRIWESLDADEQLRRARRCLEDHGREICHPIWKRGNGTPRVIARVHEMRACNIIPGMMAAPDYSGAKQTGWTAITNVQREDFEGEVYSLQVDPHQTYVADGIVTHNCIFQWRGADPAAFTASNIPEENRQVLSQSYRVPAAVHAQAVRWINQMEGRERVEYHPRDHDGEVRILLASWQETKALVQDVEQYLERDMTVMFLTTCSYMLQPLIRALRENGIPFHNPYRRRNGAWNPLRRRRGQTSTADRIIAFLQMSQQGAWTAEDLNRWTDMAKVRGTLQTDGRKRVKQLTDDEDGAVSWEGIMTVLTEEAVEAGLSGNLDWLQEQVMAEKKTSSTFPLAIARNRGIGDLTRPPSVTVGTVHSVKGAEADVVYVFPDLSRAGMEEWNGSSKQQASVYRLFYVAMTRAKDTLVLAQPAEYYAVNLE